MPTALASEAAAITAGYRFTKYQKPGGGLYVTRVEKSTTGAPGQSGFLWIHEVESAVNQADADTKALAAINEARHLRYGRGATGGNKDKDGGTALTVDVQ